MAQANLKLIRYFYWDVLYLLCMYVSYTNKSFRGSFFVTEPSSISFSALLEATPWPPMRYNPASVDQDTWNVLSTPNVWDLLHTPDVGLHL